MEAMDLRMQHPAQEARIGPGSGPGSGAGRAAGAPEVWTEAIEAVAARALLCLAAGHGVHLRGPAGTGKTTLAFALAARLGRDVVAVLPGAEADASSAVAVASAAGATAILDADAEGFPAVAPRLSAALGGRLPAHAAFRAIVVSRPGSPLPVTLLDRLVTIDCDGYDRETELAIAAARSGLGAVEAGRIVDMVRDLRRSREYGLRPGLRCSITLASLAMAAGCAVSSDDHRFVALVLDVLGARLRTGPDGLLDPRHRQMLVKLTEHFCGERQQPPVPA
jgi:nitric oxide reductase NorQ protein